MSLDEMRALGEAAGFDLDTLMSLPESIRSEVLEQVRSDQQAAARAATGHTESNGSNAAAAEMDNATFLASL